MSQWIMSSFNIMNLFYQKNKATVTERRQSTMNSKALLTYLQIKQRLKKSPLLLPPDLRGSVSGWFNALIKSSSSSSLWKQVFCHRCVLINWQGGETPAITSKMQPIDADQYGEGLEFILELNRFIKCVKHLRQLPRREWIPPRSDCGIVREIVKKILICTGFSYQVKCQSSPRILQDRVFKNPATEVLLGNHF